MKTRFYNFEPKPVHITGHFKLKNYSSAHISELWESILFGFDKTRYKFKIKFYSTVLLDNHFHLLCSQLTGEEDIQWSDFIETLERFLIESYKYDLEFYGLQYFIIENIKHFQTTYKYIYRNPIEAGLSKTVTSYPYSSLCLLTSGKDKKALFTDNMNLMLNSGSLIQWLENPCYTNHTKVSKSRPHFLHK